MEIRDVIFSIMRKHKIDELHVNFDGSGDSGAIESIEFVSNKENDEEKILNETKDIQKFVKAGLEIVKDTCWKDGEWVKEYHTKESIEEVKYSFKEIIHDFCYDNLEEHHGGWENNEGGNGQFVFDLKDETIVLKMNIAVISYESEETSL
jgi:hypothetical protein